MIALKLSVSLTLLFLALTCYAAVASSVRTGRLVRRSRPGSWAPSLLLFVTTALFGAAFLISALGIWFSWLWIGLPLVPVGTVFVLWEAGCIDVVRRLSSGSG